MLEFCHVRDRAGWSSMSYTGRTEMTYYVEVDVTRSDKPQQEITTYIFGHSIYVVNCLCVWNRSKVILSLNILRANFSLMVILLRSVTHH